MSFYSLSDDEEQALLLLSLDASSDPLDLLPPTSFGNPAKHVESDENKPPQRQIPRALPDCPSFLVGEEDPDTQEEEFGKLEEFLDTLPPLFDDLHTPEESLSLLENPLIWAAFLDEGL